MRTRKQELVSDNLKPFICKIIKEARLKHNYSLEDLAKALDYQKNRQTLHKYETGTLNIPYDVFFEICRIFSINNDILSEIPKTKEEEEIFEKKMIKEYVNSMRTDKNLTKTDEKIINTFKNASFEVNHQSKLAIKVLDDSMEPVYYKNDKIYFEKQEEYKTGDDIIIATKSNVLSIRRLYKYPKGIILQALNPKYPTININIISNEMILGKVISIYREIK